MQTTQQQTNTKPDLSEEGPTRGSNTCEMVHILAIVVAQAKKLLYMLDTGGCGPFTNGRQLGWVHLDLAMANYVAQVRDLALKKCTFIYLHHIAGECKGGSGQNGGSISAPRGYYYTRGYHQGTQLHTDQAH